MASLTITPPGGDPWEKALNKEQSQQVDKFLQDCGERDYPIPFAALITVRTNSLENFAKDFFLPTLINHAFRVEGAAYMAIATIAALFFDILTLPIRVVTLIPRIQANTNRPENKFHKWLRKNKAPDFILHEDVVRVKHEWPKLGGSRYWKHTYNFIEAPTGSAGGSSSTMHGSISSGGRL